MLTTIEKVIYLQDVDIFELTRSEDLARIAAIAEEVEVPAGEPVFEEGDIADATYVIIEGRVRLVHHGTEVMVAGPRDIFGTWALFDDEPRVVTARVIESCRLLRIDKEDFIDLLADHVQITRSILKKMVRRLRNLMSRARGGR